MTTVALPVTGQDINLAARATRKALDILLADQGTSFPPLATLNSIVSRGASLDCDALIRTLAHAFDVDQETVWIVLHGLETRGLVRQSTATADSAAHFELTDAGNAEHKRLTAIVGELTNHLYCDFDAEELATTRRVLVTLTERANARVESTLS